MDCWGYELIDHCPCKRCTVIRPRRAAYRQELEDAKALACMTKELDAPYEPPTANQPDELPDQEGRRYPLMRAARWDAPTLVLLAYLFRLLWWRCRTWSQRRRGLE